ncbi:hypothetical protein DMH20_24540 [Escherichia coli]|nr:hypothetical protein [Escherichia coli]
MAGAWYEYPRGAFSVDVTHSNVSIPDDKTYQGQSYRISEQVI